MIGKSGIKNDYYNLTIKFMTKQKIGIFGGGVLGKAMKHYFPEAKIYDKYNVQDSLEEVINQDIIFICVPTPYTAEAGFDLTEMNNVFDDLKQVKNKIVVIRSTVLPGTTEKYQEQYPDLKILFNPEFLTEATATEDFLHPDKQIIGYANKNQDVAVEILNLLPDAPFKKVLPAKEAEMVKYMINSFYAVKVIFANQIYDICQTADINYDLVKEAFSADKRIGAKVIDHLEIFHKNYRGFGGKCLRKDIYSLIDFAKQRGFSPKLLEIAKEINLNLNDGK